MSAHLTVFGKPVEHSLSPILHQAFAKQCGVDLLYTKTPASMDKFESLLREFYNSGGLGANVTTPLKQLAFELCQQTSANAAKAQAVNTLHWKNEELWGFNTDGVGLIHDITHNHQWSIQNKNIIIFGAGGAAKGILGPLLEAQPSQIMIVNRNFDKAVEICDYFDNPLLVPGDFERLAHHEGCIDIMINATSSSLTEHTLAIPDALFEGCFAYDLMYHVSRETAFTKQAMLHGASKSTDGMGMLIEQGALSFEIWFGQKPDTQPVLDQYKIQQ